MKRLDAIARGLALAPRITVQATLARRAPLADLSNLIPPDFLYTSRRANRFNPAGTECLYFSKDEDTARLEHERYWAGLAGSKQPFVTFFARVRLQSVLDLTAPLTLSILKLRPEELHQDWRKATNLTKTQLLGLAIATRTRISAIQYPSDAASAAGSVGTNLVIFRAAVREPDYVKILGPKKQALQHWP